MEIRRLLGDCLTVLTVAFTACLSVIMVRRISTVVLKKSYIKVFFYELIACAFLIALALDIRFGFITRMLPNTIKAVGWCLRAVVMLVAAVLLFFMGKIALGSLIRTEASARHAIVLGLALKSGKPTDDLIARLDTAEAYWRKNPDAALILTGGNADASGITEAAAMRDILMERGVPRDRMILEDQAETTKENFQNTAKLVSPSEPVVLISSNYHMDRAVRTAKNAGFTSVLRLPAPSSRLEFGANVMWEAILELNEFLLRR